jgi:hypothetical protein
MDVQGDKATDQGEGLPEARAGDAAAQGIHLSDELMHFPSCLSLIDLFAFPVHSRPVSLPENQTG